MLLIASGALVVALLFIFSHLPMSAWDALHFWGEYAAALAGHWAGESQADFHRDFFWHRHTAFLPTIFAGIATASLALGIPLLIFVNFLVTIGVWACFLRLVNWPKRWAPLLLFCGAISLGAPLTENMAWLAGYAEPWVTLFLAIAICNTLLAVRSYSWMRFVMSGVFLLALWLIKSTGPIYVMLAVLSCVFATVVTTVVSEKWALLARALPYGALLSVTGLHIFGQGIWVAAVADMVQIRGYSLDAQILVDKFIALKSVFASLFVNSSFGILLVTSAVCLIASWRPQRVMPILLASESLLVLGLATYVAGFAAPDFATGASPGADTGGSRFLQPIVTFACYSVLLSTVSEVFENNGYSNGDRTSSSP